MGGQDRKIRGAAVTLRGSVFGHNYMDETEYDLSNGIGTPSGAAGKSDLLPLLASGSSPVNAPNPLAVNSIRIMQPHFGEVVECYLDYIQLRYSSNMDTTPSHEALNTMFLAIGDFTNNDFTTPRTSYTPAELKASWKAISGLSTELSVAGGGDSRVSRSRINLLPALYKNGNAKYVEDGFNLLLCFNGGLGAPWGGDNVGGTYFTLEFFRVTMSITGIT